ncbi:MULTISPECIES: disulfide oxidoreductase [Bacillus cereus group]|uniref:Probable disulfide formation protein n=1 Tax=Bacillus cereus VD048 TaxID=1053226 RepID=J8HND4_BACCE|nr:disulfide oxidoreductase [Bacillus cereus]EJR26671.1 hypothetical protein IIG_05228 [Bacillus cereus VD048]
MNNEKRLELTLFIIWATSFIATTSSLYLSEIMKYEPCSLCWYQRIFMYPLVIILGIATVKKDYKISIYSLILSIIGGSISFYHYLMQKLPLLSNDKATCGRVPCNTDYLDWYGIITIPLLAFIAFIIIISGSIIIIKIQKRG